MLQNITVSNIAVVNHLEVDFHEGLTTFTGETGAGKSLLLDALNLALGSRGQLSLIRQGADSATVSAVFHVENCPPLREALEEMGFPQEDATLILRRTIMKDGRNKCFINNTPTNVSGLKAIGEHLVEIHGQFDRLLSPTHHGAVLDSFGRLEPLLENVQTNHKKWKTSLKALETTKESLKQKEENREYLTFCLEELTHVQPEAGEEETLLERRSFSLHYEKILEGLKKALHDTRETAPVENALNAAYRSVQSANQEGKLDGLLEKIDTAYHAASEAIQATEEALEDFSSQEGGLSLEEIGQRLNILRSLATKHRCTVDELPALLEKFQRDVGALETSHTTLHQLEEEEKAARVSYEASAKALRTEREKAAGALKEIVEREVTPLKLHADFAVKLTPLPQERWSEKGSETVEFHVSTNPGEASGPLSKVASGGELSRLMLALKVALKEQSHVPTLIFDEIDTGLGGAVAEAMGKRLKDLSNNTQVLAITHSPQMAAFANQHYLVSKTLKEERTETSIKVLQSFKDRQRELARMLAGSKITDPAEAAAAQLLKDACHEPL